MVRGRPRLPEPAGTSLQPCPGTEMPGVCRLPHAAVRRLLPRVAAPPHPAGAAGADADRPPRRGRARPRGAPEARGLLPGAQPPEDDCRPGLSASEPGRRRRAPSGAPRLQRDLRGRPLPRRQRRRGRRCSEPAPGRARGAVRVRGPELRLPVVLVPPGLAERARRRAVLHARGDRAGLRRGRHPPGVRLGRGPWRLRPGPGGPRGLRQRSLLGSRPAGLHDRLAAALPLPGYAGRRGGAGAGGAVAADIRLGHSMFIASPPGCSGCRSPG
mmetsp:Transcript_115435/g.313348  ORF Transcript_115435/g.313348 Transcript_115435/m.313348 type:complete len:271 (+) Transcript_115435:911-1723(+)